VQDEGISDILLPAMPRRIQQGRFHPLSFSLVAIVLVASVLLLSFALIVGDSQGFAQTALAFPLFVFLGLVFQVSTNRRLPLEDFLLVPEPSLPGAAGRSPPV
jgi:hypothetical protein